MELFNIEINLILVKRIFIMNKKILAVGILSLSLIACASNQAASQSNQPTQVIQPESSNMYSSANDADSATTISNNNNNLNADQATNSVYFGVDQYSVDEQYASVIGVNANYLASHATAMVRVEGNTDDSGSVEYNLALGQRRADAVKKSLIAKGANINQIEAISNGKLVEKFSNASDDSRAKNRRSDIMFTKQKPPGYSLNSNGLPVIK